MTDLEQRWWLIHNRKLQMDMVVTATLGLSGSSHWYWTERRTVVSGTALDVGPHPIQFNWRWKSDERFCDSNSTLPRSFWPSTADQYIKEPGLGHIFISSCGRFRCEVHFQFYWVSAFWKCLKPHEKLGLKQNLMAHCCSKLLLLIFGTH